MKASNKRVKAQQLLPLSKRYALEIHLTRKLLIPLVMNPSVNKIDLDQCQN